MKRIFVFLTIMAAAACSSTKSAAPMDMITAHRWRLESIHGQSAEASQYGQNLPYVSFAADNKIMGNGGCNSFSGSFNISEEGGISISQLVATKMACENGGNTETDFFATLEKANQAKIDEDKLTLMTGVEEIMVFRPAEE